MHIPDNYLSPSTCALLAVAATPVLIRAIKKTTREFPKERFSALGAAAAFSFLAMMFNVPLPGGATGHAVGGTVLAVLLGPEAACLSLSIALLIQALLFGDGGTLAFGANVFNMAFILPYVGYYSFLLFRKAFRAFARETEKNDATTLRLSDCVALGLGSYLGINAAALAAAVEFGVQPLLFTDGAGQALYCPYPLSVAIPAMALGHLTVFGLAEVVFSIATYTFVCKAAPAFATNEALFASKDDAASVDAARPRESKGFGAISIALAALVALTPLGLLAKGTAWGEWGTDEIAETVVDGATLGYTPEGMTRGYEWRALIPDYAINGLPEWFSYILAAIAGAALSTIVFKLVGAFLSRKTSV